MAYGAYKGIGETNCRCFRHERRGYRRGLSATRLDSLVEAFPVSLSTVAITEMSDRTQLLATGRTERLVENHAVTRVPTEITPQM